MQIKIEWRISYFALYTTIWKWQKIISADIKLTLVSFLLNFEIIPRRWLELTTPKFIISRFVMFCRLSSSAYIMFTTVTLMLMSVNVRSQLERMACIWIRCSNVPWTIKLLMYIAFYSNSWKSHWIAGLVLEQFAGHIYWFWSILYLLTYIF